MPKTLRILLAVVAALTVIIGVVLISSSFQLENSGKTKTNQIVTTTMPVPTSSTLSSPPGQFKAGIIYQAEMNTTAGKMTVSLNTAQTPITAENFIKLANKGFYNNTIFHRVIKGFMIQGGDPTGTGAGNPGYKFDDEPFVGEYTRGTIAMANSGPNTNGSQFFIMHADYPLPKNYVIFGKLIDGFDTLDKIATASVTASAMGEMSKPISPVKILTVKILETPSP
jgi:cyclophilin family peptidyl-prolyl cis-trans isomerase